MGQPTTASDGFHGAFWKRPKALPAAGMQDEAGKPRAGLPTGQQAKKPGAESHATVAFLPVRCIIAFLEYS